MLTHPEAKRLLYNYVQSGVQAVNLAIGAQLSAIPLLLKGVTDELTAWEKTQPVDKKEGPPPPYETIWWYADTGFGTPARPDDTNGVAALESASDPDKLKNAQGKRRSRALVAMVDFNTELTFAATQSKLKFLVAYSLMNRAHWSRMLVLVTSRPINHPNLDGYFKVIELGPPTDEELVGIIDYVVGKRYQPHSPVVRTAVVRALAGLSGQAAADTLSLGVLQHNAFDLKLTEHIEVEKMRALSANLEAVTYVPPSHILTPDDIGGGDELKSWVARRTRAYDDQAKEIGLDPPKGIGLVGCPGTGKSVMAGMIAHMLRLPLLRFDVGAAFTALVGESERACREVIARAEAMQGCVLLLDEVDKFLGGAHTSIGDSGVTRRVLGYILDWLARKKDRTFVVVTMNRTKDLPPELLRRGRLDDIWYVDLPNEDERRQILSIHMRRRNIDPAKYSKKEWGEFVEVSDRYVGAEIEQAVIEARYTSFEAAAADKGVPTAAQLMAALEGITSFAKSDPDALKEIQSLGEAGKARPVSASTVVRKTDGGRRLATEMGRNLDPSNN